MRSFSLPQFSKNLAALAIGEGLTRLLTFVAFAHLAWVLKPELFGLVEVALAIYTIATLLSEQGLTTYGAREVARASGTVPELVTRVVSVHSGLSLAVYLILILVVLLAPIQHQLAMLLLGMGFSLLGLPFLFAWVFQGQKRMHWVAVPQVVRYAAFSLFVLVVIDGPERLLLLPVAEFFGIAAAIVLFQFAYRKFGWNFRLVIDLGGWKDLLSSTSPIGGSQLIWALRMYAPTILVASLLGQAAAGYYGAAHRILMVCQAGVAIYLTNIFPSLTEAASESRRSLAELIHKSISLVLWPAVGLAVLVSVFSDRIILLVFGESFLTLESARILQVIIWLIPILFFRTHLRGSLLAIDRQRTDFICSVAGFILLAILAPVLTLRFGVLGTTWALIVAETAATVLSFVVLKQFLSNFRFWRCLVPWLLLDWARATPEDKNGSA